MFWIFNFIFSFFVLFFFCVIFDVFRKLYFVCGFVGVCGWMVYIVLFNGFEFYMIYLSFFGSLVLGLFSYYMVCWKKEFVIIFMVIGIIFLVLGGFVYDVIKNLVLLYFGKVINIMFEVILIVGVIVLGLLFVD